MRGKYEVSACFSCWFWNNAYRIYIFWVFVFWYNDSSLNLDAGFCVYLSVRIGCSRKNFEFSGFSCVERLWNKNPGPIIKIQLLRYIQNLPIFWNLWKLLIMKQLLRTRPFVCCFGLQTGTRIHKSESFPARIVIYNFTQIWAFCYLFL